MAIFHRFISIALTVIIALFSLPAEAQKSATLTVSVRVVEECVITAALKRKLAQQLREGVRTDFRQRCSRGVRSRVNERVVDRRSIFTPPARLPRQIDKRRFSRRSSNGRSDVVLLTVSY